MLSKEASSTIFWVFGMTQPGIEPRSPGPLANTLTIMPKHEKAMEYESDSDSNSSLCSWDGPHRPEKETGGTGDQQKN